MDTTAEVAPFRLLSYHPARQAGARDSSRRAAVLRAAASRRNARRHAHARPRSLTDRRQKSTTSANSKPTCTTNFAATKNSCCVPCSAACPQANWQRVVENINSGLGGDVSNVKISDPAATREPFTLSYDVSKVNFLDWSKKKTDIVLPLVQFNLPDVDTDDTMRSRRRAPEARPQSRILLSTSSWSCPRNTPPTRRSRSR